MLQQQEKALKRKDLIVQIGSVVKTARKKIGEHKWVRQPRNQCLGDLHECLSEQLLDLSLAAVFCLLIAESIQIGQKGGLVRILCSPCNILLQVFIAINKQQALRLGWQTFQHFKASSKLLDRCRPIHVTTERSGEDQQYIRVTRKNLFEKLQSCLSIAAYLVLYDKLANLCQ